MTITHDTIIHEMRATPGAIVRKLPTHNGPPADVVIHEWTWKTPAMKAMTLAVARLAIERGNREFSALDLPTHGADDHGGTGIAGTVFGQLAKAGIIAPVGGIIDGEFVQRIVRNAHGNRIGVWRLAHGGLARALIRAHDSKPPPGEPVQLDLISNLQSPISNQPS